MKTTVSEAELNRRYGTAALLKSRGDYGCRCVIFDGDFTKENVPTTPAWFSDEFWVALNDETGGDIGTILITGDVKCPTAISVSDRLMCLVVLGSFEALSLTVFETEVYVRGDLHVDVLGDREHLVTVGGEQRISSRGSV